MDRRTFMRLSAMAAVYASRRSPYMRSDFQASDPGAYGAILGQDAYTRFGADRARLVREWQALAEIYRRTSAPTPSGAQDSAAAVRDILSTGRALDPATFNQMATILQGADPAFAQERDAFAHGLGAVLRTAGPFVGRINPAVGTVTTVAGIWAEDTLKYLAQPGLNLSVSLLPPTNDSGLAAVNALVFTKMGELYSKDADFKALLNDPAVRQQLGVDFTLSSSELLRRLAPETRDALAPLLEGSAPDPSQNPQLVHAVVNAVASEVDQLQQRFTDFTAALDEQRRDAQQQAVVQASLQQLARTRADIDGAIAIGTVLIGQVFGNSTLAQQFNTIFSAGTQVWDMAEKLSLNQVGSFAMLGSIAGAFGAIVGLFNSAPSLFSLIKEGFDRLQNQIRDLGRHLDERLNQIEFLQREELIRLQDLYDLTLRGQQSAAEQFASIQASIIQQGADDMRRDRDHRLEEHAAVVRNCRRLFATNPPPDFTQPSVQSEYRGFLTSFYQHATAVSQFPEFSVDPAVAGDTDLNAYVSKELRARGRLELLFGLSSFAFSVFNIPVTLPAVPSGENDIMPNPIEWARGVQAYVETRALTTAVESDLTQTELLSLWQMGLRLRTAALYLGSAETLNAATHALRYQSDLWHYIYSVLAEWEKGHLLQFDFDVVHNLTSDNQYANRRVYVADVYSNEGVMFHTADPLLAAESSGLIKRTVRHARTTETVVGDLSYDLVTYTLEVLKPGELENNFVIPQGDIIVSERTWSDNKRIEVQIMNSIPPAGWLVNNDLLSFCVGLYRKYVEYPTKRYDLGQWLGPRLQQPAAVMDAYEVVAGCARMCLATSYLCTAQVEEDFLWDLRCAPILGSRNQIIDALVKWTNDPTFTRSIIMTRRLLGEILSCSLEMDPLVPGQAHPAAVAEAGLNALAQQGYAVMNSQMIRGPLLIDETLRRLAGFMKVRGYNVPLPDVVPEPWVLPQRQTEIVRELVAAAAQNFSTLIRGNGARVFEHTGQRGRPREVRTVFPSPLINPPWWGCIISQAESDPLNVYVDAMMGLFDADELAQTINTFTSLLGTTGFEGFALTATPLPAGVAWEASKPLDARHRIALRITQEADIADMLKVQLFVVAPAAPMPAVPLVRDPGGPLSGKAAAARNLAIEAMQGKAEFLRAAAGHQPLSLTLNNRLKMLTQRNHALATNKKKRKKTTSKNRSRQERNH